MNKFEGNAVTWFEIPTTDFHRATHFYESILDTRLHAWPGEEHCAMFRSRDGGVGGCIINRPLHKPSTEGTLVYLNVDGQLDDVIARAEQHGATVLVPRTEIAGIGTFYACITDSEGNHIGLHSR